MGLEPADQGFCELFDAGLGPAGDPAGGAGSAVILLLWNTACGGMSGDDSPLLLFCGEEFAPQAPDGAAVDNGLGSSPPTGGKRFLISAILSLLGGATL